MGNAFPTANTSDTLPDWAIGLLVAAIVVTVLWLILLIILVTYELTKRSRIPSKPTYPRTGPLDIPAEPRPVPKRSPSPTPPVANVTVMEQTLHPSPPHSTAEERLEVHLDTAGNSGGVRPISFAVEKDDSSSGEYTLRRGSQMPSSDITATITSSVEVTRTDIPENRYESGDELDEDDQSNSSNSNREGALVGMVLSRPVTVRQLGATLRELGYLESEFRKLPANVVDPEDIPAGAEKKNRYSNVLPTTKTRVPLSTQFGRANSNYINANFVRGYRNSAKQYIATQGPMENTIEDFWRMIWEHGCEVIVMATNFQERGIEKCARYWPAQGSEEYGALQVTTEQQSSHQHFDSTILMVKNLDTGNTRTVHHYRLTCWPSQGVPATTQPITESLQEIKMADSSGPAVVHCSAGIGRTGVLIAIDIGIQAILQGDETIDVLRVVSTLRQDRAGAVLTRDQYRFVHQALYDVAREVGK